MACGASVIARVGDATTTSAGSRAGVIDRPPSRGDPCGSALAAAFAALARSGVLLDEKIGGTVHLALGRSYSETGGVNESAVHWDLICDLRRSGRLTADEVIVDQDGFKVP